MLDIKKNRFRVISIILVYISMLSLFISGNILLSYSSINFLNVSTIKSNSFFKTQAFNNQIDEDIRGCLKFSLYQELLGAKEKKLFNDNLVDLNKDISLNSINRFEYCISLINGSTNKNGLLIDGEGLKYKIIDLLEWSKKIEEDDFNKTSIYECLKENGEKIYYYLDTYKQLISSKKVYIKDINNDKYYHIEKYENDYADIISDDINNTSLSIVSEEEEAEVLSNDNLIFISTKYKEIPLEYFKPEGYSSIVEAANKNPYIATNFDTQISLLEKSLMNISSYVRTMNELSAVYDKGNNNFRYLLKYNDKIFTNDYSKNFDNLDYKLSFSDNIASISGNISIDKIQMVTLIRNFKNKPNDFIELSIGINKELSIEDNYFNKYRAYKGFKEIIDLIIIVFILSLIILLISIISAMFFTRRLSKNKFFTDNKFGMDIITLIIIFIVVGLFVAFSFLEKINYNSDISVVIIPFYKICKIYIFLSAFLYLYKHFVIKKCNSSLKKNMLISKLKRGHSIVSNKIRIHKIEIFGYIILMMYNLVVASSLMIGMIVSAIILDIIVIIIKIRNIKIDE